MRRVGDAATRRKRESSCVSLAFLSPRRRVSHSPRLLLSYRFRFNHSVVSACVVVEVAFVDAKEEHAVALGYELAACAYEDEVVVVVAYDGDESARRLVAHKLVRVGQIGYACGR